MSDLMVTGPTPGSGRQWCAACVMLIKQRFHDNRIDDMRAALADGKTGFREFPVPTRGMLLHEAVTVAVWGDAPGMPPMPVCWTHAAGINLKARSPLEVPRGGMPLPKGLIKGQG